MELSPLSVEIPLCSCTKRLTSYFLSRRIPSVRIPKMPGVPQRPQKGRAPRCLRRVVDAVPFVLARAHLCKGAQHAPEPESTPATQDLSTLPQHASLAQVSPSPKLPQFVLNTPQQCCSPVFRDH